MKERIRDRVLREHNEKLKDWGMELVPVDLTIGYYSIQEGHEMCRMLDRMSLSYPNQRYCVYKGAKKRYRSEGTELIGCILREVTE